MLVRLFKFKGNLKMLKENIKAKGIVNALLVDENGQVKLDQTINNLVVDTGLAYIASRMVDASTAVVSHMALGTSVTPPAGSQTALLSEIARVALTSTTVVTTTVTNDSVQYSATFPAGTGTGAITEAALLNAASNGIMACRTTFNVVNKDANDTLTITWKIIVS
jgi:hypothetical protein